MIEAQREAYRQEAFELLSELETSLLELEETPDDNELIGRVFRALHTIKGSGAMFGFDAIAAFTHEVETVFDLVRNDRMKVTKTLIDLTLSARDLIRAMLEDSEGGADTSIEAEEVIGSLKELVPAPNTKEVDEPQPAASSPKDAGGSMATYRIFLRMRPDIFSKGTNPILLLNELGSLGECEVFAHTETIPELEDFNPEECWTTWDVFLTTDLGTDAIRDVFIFVEDECEVEIELIDEPGVLDQDTPPVKLGEILRDRGYVENEDLLQVLGKQKRIGELLVDSGLVKQGQVEAALLEQEHIKKIRKKQQQEDKSTGIRVPAEKLDVLVNLVGEMVTVQARLSQTAGSLGHAGLLSISEEVERLTAELRDNAMSIRTVPIGTTFSKFKRLVRDLSNELGKDIALVTEGAETELDKTVIERLNDPLVHLIRNCIDHGIERPQAREEAGKARGGTVRLSAVHSGANVLISIEDDGAGLDIEAIRAKAVERGLIAGDSEMSEKEIYSLIFAPGFSTARQVTSVSGRGVGMDVVKRSIDALRGTIDISSRRGIGTTITLRLPLTLAIIDGLLVQVGGGRFVLPLSIVEECVDLSREDVARAHGRQLIHVRGEIVPYIRLRDRFKVNGRMPEVEQVVITDSSGGRVGFAVDRVIGEHQTVIKNMGTMYRNVDAISGATILGDGGVALIVDVPKLIGMVELQELGTN
jgi:two-component system chemotaxis sensor kinase CheA